MSRSRPWLDPHKQEDGFIRVRRQNEHPVFDSNTLSHCKTLSIGHYAHLANCESLRILAPASVFFERGSVLFLTDRRVLVKLYDTYARTIREFESIKPDEVGLYACGPTVYNYAHLGNLRTYIFEDVLRRTLSFHGYRVRHVMNITDVGHLASDADTGEDKMESGSKRSGKSAWEIAALYMDAFKEDLKRLNILEPTVWCRATDHIQEQIDAVVLIEKLGLTYTTSDGVYFDTSKQPNYGHLARLDVDGLKSGARVDPGQKRNLTDFALWKFSPDGTKRQMEWESPWGTGFPGWHIECSAMAAKYLGPLFDIHCGGKDHISVHHTNEIAQAEACYGTHLANYWLHGYFLQLGDEKMAKSSGEFLRLQTLLERDYDPLSFRYLCLTAHYRSDLAFSWKSLDAAATALDRLRNEMYGWGAAESTDSGHLDRFKAEVGNDLNTSRGLAVVWSLAKSDLRPGVKKATLEQIDQVLGLELAQWAPEELKIPEEVNTLVREREIARSERRWEESDSLRKSILEFGFEVQDTPEGSKLQRRSS